MYMKLVALLEWVVLYLVSYWCEMLPDIDMYTAGSEYKQNIYIYTFKEIQQLNPNISNGVGFFYVFCKNVLPGLSKY